MASKHGNQWDRRVARMKRRLELLELLEHAPADEREAIIEAIDDPDLRSEVVQAMEEDGDSLPVLVQFEDPPALSQAVTMNGTDGYDADRTPSPLRKGDRVGRYTMVDDGRGGQASVVHQAEDEATGKSVAFKLLRPSASVQDRRQFERQRVILEATDHPQISAAIDHGVVDHGPARGMPYVVVPWIEGQHFDDWAIGRSWREVARVLADALDALDVAHTVRVIHRDLKPENLLVASDEHGRPKPYVIDFGIARLSGGPLAAVASSRTTTHEIKGSKPTMAPEQLSGDREIDRRADLYAAGCMLYKVLTQAPPHMKNGDPGLLELARRRAAGPPAMPRMLDAQIRRLLRVALAEARRDRYQTAREMAEDLRRAAANLPLKRSPPGLGRRASMWVRRNPALATLAAALTIVLVAAYVIGAIQAGRIVEARDEAELVRAAADRRFESLQGFTSFVLESHDEALRQYPELIHARRDLTEQAALALAAVDAEGPSTIEQALHQAELWLLLSEIGLNRHSRSLWSAGLAHTAAVRALELMEAREGIGDPRVPSVRARALLRAKTGRLVPRLDRVAHFQEVVGALEPVYEQATDAPEVIIAYAEAVLHLGLGHAWHDGGHERAVAELRRALRLAEEARTLAPNSQRVLAIRAFILNHLGGQLRKGDAADQREAVGVLTQAVEAYDALASHRDTYLDGQAAGTRSTLAGLLMRRGHTLHGIQLYAEAIEAADLVLARDESSDRARRAAALTRYWAASDLLDTVTGIGLPSTIGPPLPDALLLHIACRLADETFELQLDREAHLRRIGDTLTLRDEARYLGTISGLRKRAHATRAILDGNPWPGWTSPNEDF
ncbi:MAG: serine/threonine protein kinase [Phycisphaerales bacterium JB060]